MSNSTIPFTLKMEYVTKIIIFGLKMMVKSGPQKFTLKSLHKFSNKNEHLPAWRDLKINFSRPLFTIIFRPKIIILVTYSILRVKNWLNFSYIIPKYMVKW